MENIWCQKKTVCNLKMLEFVLALNACFLNFRMRHFQVRLNWTAKNICVCVSCNIRRISTNNFHVQHQTRAKISDENLQAVEELAERYPLSRKSDEWELDFAAITYLYAYLTLERKTICTLQEHNTLKQRKNVLFENK